MPLFPNLGPEYLDETDRGILQRMESFYAESITINQAFWSEGDIDQRFMAGDQTLWSDIYGNLAAHRKRNFNFNRIRRVVNMVSGYQRRNRKSTIVVPIENADEVTADQFTKIMFWLNGQENILETISEAYQGALVTGMNLLHVWMDYRNDPVSGNIKVDNCSYNEFLIDPYFKKADLSDCNGIWKRSFVNKREAISLLPDHTEVILGLNPNTGGNSGISGKFQFMPESYNYGYNNLLTYDEYYYRDYRTQKMLIDTQTGETFEWRVDDEDRLKDFLRTYPQITTVDQEIPTVKLAIVVEGRVLYHDGLPSGSDVYPFVPVMGYYTPELTEYSYRIQGMVRGLRDSQFLYNRRREIELDILESQVNSGWIYKENALVNPKDVFLSGQGRGLALKEEAQMTDVQRIEAPQVPPSMIQLSELLAREVMEISGVNEELLGSASDEKAGILSMLRQGAGLTTLQVLFDQLDRSQKLLGKIIIKMVQNNFTPGKVKRILNEEPSPQFYNKAFGQYDAAVEEGLNTTTQRQLQFAQLLQLKEAGVPLPDDVLLDAATVQNKAELKQRIQQTQEAAQQQQQLQSEIAMQKAQAEIELTKARSVADQGLGVERMSRVQENQQLAVERAAQAQENLAQARESRADAWLNKVKALKELDQIDLTQIQQLISIMNALKLQDVQEEPVEQPQPTQPEPQAPQGAPTQGPNIMDQLGQL